MTAQVEKSRPKLSLDQLVAALDAVKKEDPDAKLHDDPPQILFETHPALLLLIDGPPKLESIEYRSRGAVGFRGGGRRR